MVESSKDKTYGRIIVFIIVSSLIYFSVNHTINKDKEKQSMIANQKIDSLNSCLLYTSQPSFTKIFIGNKLLKKFFRNFNINWIVINGIEILHH